MQERYAVRNKAGKGRLLDEFCEQHGYERKHAIKLLNRRPEPKVPRPRPGAPGEKKARQLREQYESLDPFDLARDVEKRLKKILK